MKTALAMLLLCAAQLVAAPIGFLQPRVGGTNLVGWWTFNATNGAAFPDLSGNGWTAYQSNFANSTKPFLRSGIVSSDAVTGVNSSGAVATNWLQTMFTNAVQSISVACWIKSYVSGSSDYRTIVAKGFNCTSTIQAPYTSFSLTIDPSSRLTWAVTTNSTASILVNSTNAILTNNWYFVVATFSKDAGINLFTNGQRAAFISAAASSVVPYDTEPMSIGIWEPNTRLGQASAYLQQWRGEIDDLKLFSTVLSASDVSLLYNGGKGTHQ